MPMPPMISSSRIIAFVIVITLLQIKYAFSLGTINNDTIKHSNNESNNNQEENRQQAEEDEEEVEAEVEEAEENIQTEQEVRFGDVKLFSSLEDRNKLSSNSSEEVLNHIITKTTSNIKSRLNKEFFSKSRDKAISGQCRSKIATHLNYYLSAIGNEESLPFSELYIENECTETKYDFDNLPADLGIGEIQNRTYQPSKEDAEYVASDELILCIGILTHVDANATIRLIEAMHVPGYVFIIHVDAKDQDKELYDNLVSYASVYQHVHILPHERRVRVNWGGFSMVNATLQILQYAFEHELQFHKFVHLASTTYPIASNIEIRRRLASYPINANLVHVVFKPTAPSYDAWHYFVECDDALHRIYRLPPLKEKEHGIDLYTSSQWFVISRDFAHYLAYPPPNSVIEKFLPYAEHIVVADESFFGTVLRHTAFCHYHHNFNYLHVQFDRWENELEDEIADVRKCVMPDPRHCGRSPTVMTLDYLSVLELSGHMFARKFIDSEDVQIKDIIDIKRKRDDEFLKLHPQFNSLPNKDKVNYGALEFENMGVLFVAKSTLYEASPLCLGLGPSGNKVLLTPCFYNDVPPTLDEQWETGGVILQETRPNNRWNIGPCSSDGSISRLHNGTLQVKPTQYSPTGPRCSLTLADGLRQGRVLDAETERVQPGGVLHAFPSVHRWHQFFSFGSNLIEKNNNENTPIIGSIHTVVPQHVIKTINRKGRTQGKYMCLGVYGRGSLDEEEWEEDLENIPSEELITSNTIKLNDNIIDENSNQQNNNHLRRNNTTNMNNDDKVVSSLQEWSNQRLITTRCDNVDAVIEWVAVPFIKSEEEESEGEGEYNEEEEEEDYYSADDEETDDEEL